MRSIDLLTIISRVRPEVWDVIVPRYSVVKTRADAVALNPQPLPPLPPPDAFLVGAAEMAHAVTRMAVEAEVRGESAAFVDQLIEDWCGTPWPRRWPWPWPDPRTADGPMPDPWTVGSGRMVGAIVFASVGARLEEGDLRTSLLEGAEKLAEAAMPG
ncbi:hypothetical protein [Ornithinimicrobium sp. W1665]|uniref:hypothetical protein n=1 Tax=Ornithinimicrobium sp. W1665 TaxID=3416666 RepID=UPI003CEEFD82